VLIDVAPRRVDALRVDALAVPAARGATVPAAGLDGAISERLQPLVASGELRDDAPLLAGDRVLLASTRAVVRDGRRAGTVVTLRDRTEVEALGRELDTVRALADALRAQAHESANRLHAIAGLIELGRGDEAARLAGTEAAATQELLGRLGHGIEEPALVALLLGKAAAAGERGVELHVGKGARLHAGFPPATLVTIVGNLIDNALDALDPSRPGRIDVMLIDDGAVAVVEVADDGPGFPPELLDRAFEAGVTSKRAGSGPRGLGLALVRRAVLALGGTVEAHNDGGAVVTVTLPHTAAVEDDGAGAAAGAVDTPGALPAGDRSTAGAGS
jgi:two-component system CitB family sensor kinase